MGKAWSIGGFEPQEQTHDDTMAGLMEEEFRRRWKHSLKVLECQGEEYRLGPGPT